MDPYGSNFGFLDHEYKYPTELIQILNEVLSNWKSKKKSNKYNVNAEAYYSIDYSYQALQALSLRSC
jgi:hypothetical protein